MGREGVRNVEEEAGALSWGYGKSVLEETPEEGAVVCGCSTE